MRNISKCPAPCNLSSLPGAHGLFVGITQPAFGALYVSNTRLAMTNFGTTTDAFNTPLSAVNDHVYHLQANESSKYLSIALIKSCLFIYEHRKI